MEWPWRAVSGRLRMTRDGGVFVWEESAEHRYVGHVVSARVESRDNGDLKTLRVIWIGDNQAGSKLPEIPA
jgi:hypothetical protein